MFGKYLIILLFLNLFSKCYGTQCYKCESSDGNCKSVSVVRCPGKCILLRFTTDGPKVLKDCAPDGLCSTLISILKISNPKMSVNECNICDKRLCNSASTFNSALTFVIMAAALSLYFG